MVILGLDPAIRTSGYAVLRCPEGNGELELLDCGVIKNALSLPHSECMYRIYGGVTELIDRWHPEQAAMEEPFVGKNARTAIILGMARGAFLTALRHHELPVYSYMPSVAKRAATGSGQGDKRRIAYLLASQFNLALENIPLDCTDALALAICHWQKLKLPELYHLGKQL